MPLYLLINLCFTLLFGYSLYIVNNGTSKYSEVDGHIRGREINIEFNKLPNNKPQKFKLHNMAKTQQKLHLWLVIKISLGSIISDLASIAVSIGVLNSNSTWTWRRN